MRTLNGHRHQARWAALGAQRLPGLLSGHAAREPQLDLLATPREADDIVDVFDRAAEQLQFPQPEHPYSYLIAARLHAFSDTDAAEIKAKSEALTQTSMKMGEALYKAAQAEAENEAATGADSSQSGDDVVDADFEEVDENDRKNASN